MSLILKTRHMMMMMVMKKMKMNC